MDPPPVAHRQSPEAAIISQAQSVLRWGPTARDLLTAAPRGRVLAVMSQAVYLECESGEIVWLTTDAAPMHWRALVLDPPLSQPSAEAPFAALAAGIGFDDGVTVGWNQAELWQPPAIAGGETEGLPPRLRALRPAIEALPEPRGFGVLLGPIVDDALSLAAHSPAATEDRVLRQALPAILAVRDSLHQGDLDGALARAEPLLGLGEGLTPSGDDFVGGLLFGFAMLHAFDPALPCFSPEALDRFLATARRRTHRISHALLRDHAVGHASEPLHQYLAALLSGESLPSLQRWSRTAIQIGHSTGWDTFSGLWTALAAIVHTSGHP